MSVLVIINEGCYMDDVINTCSSGNKSPCAKYGNRISEHLVFTLSDDFVACPPRWMFQYSNRGTSEHILVGMPCSFTLMCCYFNFFSKKSMVSLEGG